MHKKATLYIIGFVTFSVLQYMWLQVAARDIYKRALEQYVSNEFSLVWFILFGVIFSAGLTYIAITREKKRPTMGQSLLRAGVFGGLVFGLINIKNLQFLQDWQLGISVIDTIWGAVVATASVALTLIIFEKLEETRNGAKQRPNS